MWTFGQRNEGLNSRESTISASRSRKESEMDSIPDSQDFASAPHSPVHKTQAPTASDPTSRASGDDPHDSLQLELPSARGEEKQVPEVSSGTRNEAAQDKDAAGHEEAAGREEAAERDEAAELQQAAEDEETVLDAEAARLSGELARNEEAARLANTDEFAGL